MREETYIERGKGPGPRNAELVHRGREDSIEDIPRDFPPPGRDYRGSRGGRDDYDAPRRAKSTGGRRYDDYDDDRYTDYAAPAAAGAAGYAAGRRRDRRHRDDRDYDSDYSRSPPRHERKKSGVGELVESLGLGGLVGGVLGSKGRDRSRSGSRGGRSVRSRSRGARSRRGSEYGSDRSRSRGNDKGRSERKWAQAAQAALVAGAVEAFRSRREPGPWTGEKGRRIATAAIGAGGIDGLIDRDPDKKSKRHLAEAVIGGLAANRLANGPRGKSQTRGFDSRDTSPNGRPRSRSRSVIDRLRGRSQSRGRGQDGEGGGSSGAIKGLVGAGALAAAGKAVYDRVRSKSRKRRSRSRDSSADSYVPSRRRALDRRRSPRSDTGSTRRTDAASARGGQGGREVARGTSNGGGALTAGAAGAGAGAAAADGGDKSKGDGNDSSDSSSTTDMEKTRKHMRGKEIITASLATVATIHAAHGVYSSMEAHEKRHRLVAEGEMSPEEARKKQTKAWIQDAAAVGIAALGIKGAFSEWKEMKEQRYGFPLHMFGVLC